MAAGPDMIERMRAALAPRAEVREAYLFGSRARGQGAAHSDADVAVYVDHIPDSPFGYPAELASDLMAVLGESRVDVIVLNGAAPLLYHRVLRDGVLIISRDPRATTARAGQALSRYCDFAIQLAKIDAVQAARIGRGEFGR
jgi:predicted nucleotidyltransferase